VLEENDEIVMLFLLFVIFVIFFYSTWSSLVALGGMIYSRTSGVARAKFWALFVPGCTTCMHMNGDLFGPSFL